MSFVCGFATTPNKLFVITYYLHLNGIEKKVAKNGKRKQGKIVITFNNSKIDQQKR